MIETKKGRKSARKKKKKTLEICSFCISLRHFGADEGTRTHMVSHRNLKPARLPVSPHPHIFLLTFVVTQSAATPTTITFRHADRRTLHNTHLTQHSTVIPHQTRSDRNQFHRRLFQLTVRTLDLPSRTAA